MWFCIHSTTGFHTKSFDVAFNVQLWVNCDTKYFYLFGDGYCLIRCAVRLSEYVAYDYMCNP